MLPKAMVRSRSHALPPSFAKRRSNVGPHGSKRGLAARPLPRRAPANRTHLLCVHTCAGGNHCSCEHAMPKCVCACDLQTCPPHQKVRIHTRIYTCLRASSPNETTPHTQRALHPRPPQTRSRPNIERAPLANCQGSLSVNRQSCCKWYAPCHDTTTTRLEASPLHAIDPMSDACVLEHA